MARGIAAAAMSTLGLALVGCGSTGTILPAGTGLEVHSTELSDGTFPRADTCDGGDHSPAISWSGLPGRTMEIAFEMTDPDAPGGTFTHWVVYGLGPKVDGFSPPPSLGLRTWGEGKNSFGTIGYRGPCPPAGATHHYLLEVFALDRVLHAPDGIGRGELDARMNRHIIARGELVATYRRG